MYLSCTHQSEIPKHILETVDDITWQNYNTQTSGVSRLKIMLRAEDEWHFRIPLCSIIFPTKGKSELWCSTKEICCKTDCLPVVITQWQLETSSLECLDLICFHDMLPHFYMYNDLNSQTVWLNFCHLLRTWWANI